MKKLVSIAAVFVLILTVTAHAAAKIPVYRVDGALLFFDKETGEITGFAGEPVNLDIPTHIGGYKVLSIGKNAFLNCVSLKSVSIPASVNFIGEGAFKSCTALSRISFGGTVENILVSAFDGTPWAQDTTEEFVVAGNTLLLRYNGNAKDVFVPAGIKKIAPYAFAYNTDIERVALPEGLIEIGDNAFVHCYSLSGISFPASLSRVGIGAFDDTVWLRRSSEDFVKINGILVAYNGSDSYVTVPEGITSISGGVFMSNDRVKAVSLPSGIRSVNEFAFGEAGALQCVIVPDGVEWMDDYAFFGSKYMVLFGDVGSYTEYYARLNRLPFSPPIGVNVNGSAVYFDVPPIILGETTYVPMRAVLEALGFSVFWDEYRSAVRAENAAVTLTAAVDSKKLTVNGKEIEAEYPVIRLNGRVMLPVRSVAEALGTSVSWDNETRTVIIVGSGL